MSLFNSNKNYKFILGDSLSVLKSMPDESVNCIITSPPYWGMRTYDNAEDRNEIGNESDYRIYIDKLVSVFQEAKRVLVKDGSFWLNLGDKYENKALMGMPWRVALALIDNGWILRNDVIWNQMKGTQSCKDRLRDSYEHFFHFVKSKKYFYDPDSIRIKPQKTPIVQGKKIMSATGVSGKKYRQLINSSCVLSLDEKKAALAALDQTLEQIKNGEIVDFRMTIRGVQRVWHGSDTKISGRALELEKKGYYIMKIGSKGALPTDIWNIVTEDVWRKDNHCAVYPEALLRIPILATCPINGIVLDPFSGTGTTIRAACKLNRKGIGIDLSPEYIKTSEKQMGEFLI